MREISRGLHHLGNSDNYYATELYIGNFEKTNLALRFYITKRNHLAWVKTWD